jgi:hypothetical protein
VTARIELSRGALLAAPRGDNVRFGAAVYGSLLVASVVGVAFEAGQDARVMTTSAFGSALVFWLAHWWSEVIGEQISAGEAFRHRDVLVVARREWPLVEAASFRRSSSRLLGPAHGRTRRAPSSRSPQRCSRSRGGRWSPAVAPDGPGCARGLFAAVDGALGIVLLLLEKLVH